MTTVFLAQLLIPVLLVLWLCVLPPSSHLGWAMQLVATLELLAVATRVGIWMFPPWWTPNAAGIGRGAAELAACGTSVLAAGGSGGVGGGPRRYRRPRAAHHWLHAGRPGALPVYGMPCWPPCSDAVVLAVDGLPDMPVPEYDRAYLAGNHMMLDCDGVHIALAHLKRGSVRVQVGQPLGAVGNSGGSNEPHLHIHVQRPGTATAPMGGAPLPMLFAGRFLVRGDRVNLPGLHP